MFDEKKTSRNIYFVSIHNSLYTQCIGAPIKKHLFFQTFFQHFLKSHRFFFLPTESKESSVHEQATTEFLIMSCGANNSAAQIHIISEAKKNKKKTKRKTKT